MSPCDNYKFSRKFEFAMKSNMFENMGLAFRLRLFTNNRFKYAYMMVNGVSEQIVTFYMHTTFLF